MKLLVIGKTGFLGSFLSASRGDESLCVESVGRDVVDLSRPIDARFRQFLERGSFHAVAICAAVTDIERCFQNQHESYQINVTGTLGVLDILREMRLKPIYFSSDYVFEPTPTAHFEEGRRRPETCYGRQKLLVEQYLEMHFENFLIFRTSKLMSTTAHPKNILWSIIENLNNGVVTPCFQDQWVNPVFVEDIAKVVKMSVLRDLQGAYHLGTRNILTRFEIGQRVADMLGYDRDLVKPIRLQDRVFSEKRPSYHTLHCEKIEKALGYQFKEIVDVRSSLIDLKTGPGRS